MPIHPSKDIAGLVSRVLVDKAGPSVLLPANPTVDDFSDACELEHFEASERAAIDKLLKRGSSRAKQAEGERRSERLKWLGHDWRERARERVADAQRGKPDGPVIISHGAGRYSIDGQGQSLRLTDSEDDVLSAFLKSGGPLNLSELIEQSKVKTARDVLRNLRGKYQGKFAPAIVMPKRKAAGGYRVSIRPAP